MACSISGLTLTCATGNVTDVLACLNAVSADFSVVVIPVGTWTWSGSGSPVVYNQVYSTTIKGLGNTTGSDSLGNPTGYNDQTQILDNVTHSGNPNQTLVINTASGKYMRITGISFLTASGQSSNPFNGMIAVNGTSHAVRFDHNHLEPTLSGEGLLWNATAWGVIDHNYFQVTTGANSNFTEITASNWKGGSDSGGGDASWTDVSNFGTQQFVFIENNTFVGSESHVVDCESGGRAVYRYNTVLANQGFQSHGTGHDGSLGNSGRARGCRAMEIYGNNASVGGGFAFWMEFESGSGLIWNNTVASYNSFIEFNDVRTNTSTYTQIAAPNGWGQCSSAPVSGIAGPSPWDQNTSGQNGDRCLDGIGSGAGQLLTGGSTSDFAPTINSVTGTQIWPNQVSDPVYVWGNAVSGLVNSYVSNFSGDNTTTQNRDYYAELPNFNNASAFTGATGIGCGPSAGVGCANPVAQPTTCAAGVGYWNPALNTFYVCTAGNTWTPYYIPYTYPHPLASEPSWGNMDMWLQMNTSTPGTTLTTTILAAGTVAATIPSYAICSASGSCNNTPSSLYTVGASQGSLGGSIVVNGVSYPTSTPTQSLALSNSATYTWTNIGIPSVPIIVANGYFTTPGAGTGTTDKDLIVITDINGNYAVMQLNNPFGLSTHYMRIETNGSGTIRSPNITLNPNYRYSFSFQYNSTTNVSSLAVFDPANSFAQIACTAGAQGTCLSSGTVTVAQISTDVSASRVSLGNQEAGVGAGTMYYEDVMFDWTNFIFPNYPQGAPNGVTTLSPTSQNFGTIGVGSSSSTVTFALTNNSASLVTGITIANVGGNTGDFPIQSTSCGTSLAVSASCQIIIAFQPITTGSRSTTLTITDSDSTSPQTSALSGTGAINTYAFNNSSSFVFNMPSAWRITRY